VHFSYTVSARRAEALNHSGHSEAESFWRLLGRTHWSQELVKPTPLRTPPDTRDAVRQRTPASINGALWVED